MNGAKLNRFARSTRYTSLLAIAAVGVIGGFSPPAAQRMLRGAMHARTARRAFAEPPAPSTRRGGRVSA